MQPQTLNLSGRLYDLSTPLVMGIVNLTPDSFYSASRVAALDALRQRIDAIVAEGGDLVDIGGYSSRPGAAFVSPEDERARLEPALRLLRDEYPLLPVSVDTFRGDIAAWARDEYGVALINDISGGTLDETMFDVVAERQLPYIMMHMRGTPQTMATLVDYDDLLSDVADFFIERVGRLRELGLHDIVLDPGFGFAKTLDQNYELLARLAELRETLGLPMLVGLSRKSMIYRYLDTTAEEALNGTTVLNTWALLHGADILRVHDVAEARQAVRLVEKIVQAQPDPRSRVEVFLSNSQ